jgi:hypothetical protein
MPTPKGAYDAVVKPNEVHSRIKWWLDCLAKLDSGVALGNELHTRQYCEDRLAFWLAKRMEKI